MSAFRVVAYLVIVAAGSPDFLAGWLTVNEAVVISVLSLLGSLIVVSSIHLGPASQA
jgi:hypothetical protein